MILRQFIAILCAPALFLAWGMGVYWLMRSMGAKTNDDYRRWRKRYYKCAAVFVISWLILMVAIKLWK